MTIKICGITNREDAVAAVEGGATALGFNFYERSLRCTTPEDAAAAGEGFAGVLKVGVFVNAARERVEEIARAANLDVAQLHGDETPGDYPAAVRVWKAVRVDDAFSFAEWTACPAEALLFDGPAETLYGGAGKTFDWRVVTGAGRRFVIAGGLDGSNVARAIALARPWGVDACSRIERAPGKKDHRKMAEFLKAAREAFACC